MRRGAAMLSPARRILRFGGGDAAAETPFLPSDIAGLAVWLDADDAATAYQSAGGGSLAGDGDVVGEWRDRSGSNRHAAQATTSKKPTRRAGVLNSRAVIRFDGADDVMEVAVPTLAARTVIIVARKIGPVVNTNGRFWDQGVATVYRSSSGEWFYYSNQAGADVALGGSTAQVSVVSVVYASASAATAFCSGGTGTAFDPADGYSGVASLFLGASNAAGIAAENCEVAEFLLYDSALSGLDRGRVEAYLAQKWGVTLT